MGEVSKGQGRTVLFVSHNMGAVQKLCTSGIFMNNGTIQSIGDVQHIMNQYFKKEAANSLFVEIDPFSYTELQHKNGFAQSVSFEDLAGNKLSVVPVGRYWQVKIKYTLVAPMEQFIIGIGIVTSNEIPVYTAWSKATKAEPGVYEAVFINDELLFATGHYRMAVGLSNNETSFHFIEEALSFEVLDIKEEEIKNDERVLRTSGTGVVINPITVNVKLVENF